MCVLKVELMGIDVELDMGYENIREDRDGSRIFDLSSSRIVFSLTELTNIWEIRGQR